MNNERGGGQAYEMGVARRTDYLVYKKKLVHTRTSGRKDIYLDSKKFSTT